MAAVFVLSTLISAISARAAPLPRTSLDVYRDIQSWITEHGASHIYPGPRFGEDFFCFDPSKCRDAEGGQDIANPVMDHLAELTDEYIVRTFQETLGSNQTVFRGKTSRGEPCEADLNSLRILADIRGAPYDDYFRADWNDDGYWWRFRVVTIEPGSSELLSQPDALKRAAQRLFSPRHSEEQHFKLRKLGAGGLQVSLWVNTSEPEHILDWRRRKVVCQF
jgi:hypothetical protein